MDSQVLAYIGIIIAVLIPVLGFGWRLLTVSSKTEHTIDRVCSILTKIEDNMNENDVTHAEIVARLKVFETKIEAELKAIHVRLDNIEEQLK